MPSSGVRDVTGRMRQRRRQLLWRRILVGLIAVLLVALIACGAWIAMFSSVLDAQYVEVKGATTLAKETVVTAAKVPIGSPLARVNTATIAANVRSLPQIKEASVKRKLPHTVVVVVVERVPLFVTKSPGGLQLVDEYAVNFLSVSEPPAGLRVVTLTKDPDAAMLKDLVVVTRMLKEPLAKGNLEADTRDSIVVTVDGVRVFLGSVDQIEQKIETTKRMLALPQPKTMVDVSSPSHPVLK